MINMKTPPVFREFCKRLGPDLDLSLARPGVTIFTIALNGFPPEKITELVMFFDALLASPLTEDELVEFWWRMPSNIRFESGSDIVKFLTDMREVASKSPYTVPGQR